MVTDAVLAVPIKTDVVPRPTIGAFVSAAPTVTEFPMATPERLVTKILMLKDSRDNNGIYSINIFEILMELHENMESEVDKRLIRDKLNYLREKISKDN